MLLNLSDGWKELIGDQFEKDYMLNLKKFLLEEIAITKAYLKGCSVADALYPIEKSNKKTNDERN
jgi:uracil DNA glycosylase